MLQMLILCIVLAFLKFFALIILYSLINTKQNQRTATATTKTKLTSTNESPTNTQNNIKNDDKLILMWKITMYNHELNQIKLRVTL